MHALVTRRCGWPVTDQCVGDQQIFSDERIPKDKGYQIIESDAVSLLLLRLEGLNSTAGPAMGEFLGLRGLELSNHNVAEKKPYAGAYQAFKNRLRLPGAYLDTLYDSEYARHFYTEREITGFRQRWQVI